MKLAVSGKGGVGKTTLVSLLARLYAEEGHKVIAIDADPDANLASALGFPAELARSIVPISEMKDLIEERTGAKPGTMGGIFRLNPRVDDIPERYSARYHDVRLLVMGTVKKGGSGCVCPESVLLKSLVRYLLLERSQVVLMDMEAGVEHLGRGTAEAVNAMIVVVEPGLRSVETAHTIAALAGDIRIPHVFAVGCKVRSESDREFILRSLPDVPVLGYLSYSPLAIEADLAGKSVYDLDAGLVAEARTIKAMLGELLAVRSHF
ncbi:MAG: AAA family ATPase [Chloroflexi bacterium]|nr:AAA family ATPase [Chloroflexota bacterium]